MLKATGSHTQSNNGLRLRMVNQVGLSGVIPKLKFTAFRVLTFALVEARQSCVCLRNSYKGRFQHTGILVSGIKVLGFMDRTFC
jgi:hypothetical protein